MASSSAVESLTTPIPRRRLLIACAWAVHLYTAVGGALGLLAIYYAAANDFRASFIAMAVATLIDSSDGALARRLDVRSRVPSFDGALLDNIVDYLNYAAAPVFLMLRANIIRSNSWGLLLASAVMLASAYGFCRADAKTSDNYFLGFPSYWNIVALYLFCLHFDPVTSEVIVGLLVVLTFLPIKFIYPSRTAPLRRLTVTLGIIWGAVVIAMLAMLPGSRPIMVYGSLSFVAYYFVASFVLHARAVIARRQQRPLAG